MKIQIINGPTPAGRTRARIYGNSSFNEYLDLLRGLYEGVDIDYFQSNIEGR